jgi:hypothetical protein
VIGLVVSKLWYRAANLRVVQSELFNLQTYGKFRELHIRTPTLILNYRKGFSLKYKDFR